MNKFCLPIALLATVVVLAGCSGAPAVAGKNCGTSESCMEIAITTCDPAYGTMN